MKPVHVMWLGQGKNSGWLAYETGAHLDVDAAKQTPIDEKVMAFFLLCIIVL